MADNLRGTAFMMLAMAGFALNDAAMKLTLDHYPLMPVLAMRGVFVCAVLLVLCIATGALRFRPARRDTGALIVRVGAEVVTAVLFLSALSQADLGTATAVLQASPLAVTLAAALFLGEPVGWRRAAALVVGFGGVLLILRPTSDAFEPALLLALAAVGTIVIRDMATRRLSAGVPSLLVALWTSLAGTLLGAVATAFGILCLSGCAPALPGPAEAPLAAAVVIPIAAVFMVIASVYSVRAMRVGDIGFIAPFRYSVLIWAMLAGVLLYGERPAALTLLGAALVVGSGVYTALREQKLARAAQGGS